MSILYVKDFSITPGARYRSLGKASGEEFRDDVLVPALNQDPNLVVNLDGVRGYGSSFLDEAFAGLIRVGVATDTVLALVSNLQSENQKWKTEIITYVNEAIQKLNSEKMGHR